MQQSMRCLQRPSTLPRGPAARAPLRVAAASARPQRAQQQPGEPEQQQARQQKQQQCAAARLAAAAAGPSAAALLAPLAALAENAAGAEAAASGQASAGFYAVACAPLLIYALFWLYRDRVNPKATIGDLLYIVGAVVVFGNIISILVFKTRFF